MSFDAIVVGAGPAGTSAAMRLAGSGLSVAVVDRLEGDRHSRYHRICGEAVSDRMFDRIGWKPSSVACRVHSISISMGGARIVVPAEGCIVDRPAMLAEMRSLCDAEFVHGAVKSVCRTDGGYVLGLADGRTMSCRSLIGADGAHSAVRRHMFGLGPTESLPIVNCIAEGVCGPDLGFRVGGEFPGAYEWRFPSSPGRVSVGFPKGTASVEDVEGLVEWGARDLPFGVVERVVDGDCYLVGDAACLANPLCYGGIGVAMLSGRMAAEAVIAGRPERYSRWVSRSGLFDPHFMKAHEQFSEWTEEETADAMRPFAKGYSVWRGAVAAVTHPRRFNVYLATFLAFRRGW
ncbi:MAG: NAD(P)/FAD-dependent oxidoreductase [Thermoplasmata archaeon]|nr:NAD(P)/FAD-dependent oxidoreductase [Thermoplasmata archaeon]